MNYQINFTINKLKTVTYIFELMQSFGYDSILFNMSKNTFEFVRYFKGGSKVGSLKETIRLTQSHGAGDLTFINRDGKIKSLKHWGWFDHGKSYKEVIAALIDHHADEYRELRLKEMLDTDTDTDNG